MPNPIGLRNKRVRIEAQVLVADGQGGHTVSWALRAVVWAREEPLSSREALLAKQLTAVLLSAWTIPYRTDVLVTDRILLGTRTLALTSHQDVDGHRAELRLLCSEAQDAPRTGVPLVPTWIQQDFAQ